MIPRKISIITIVFNDAEGLERTIKSVINQTFIDYEYIIIDGGSTDGSVNVINKYKNKISKWISEPDKGIYDAMNKGIKIASGEWINMMNAGDCFADDNVLLNIFSQIIPENKSFIYSDVYTLRKNGQRICRPLSYDKGNLIHQTIIYKRELHEEHGYYIVTKKIIISDYLFFIRIPREEIMKTNIIIAEYEGGGISTQGNWARQQAYCADVVFRRRSFYGMLRAYMWKKIKSILPIEVKDIIKNVLGIKGTVG